MSKDIRSTVILKLIESKMYNPESGNFNNIFKDADNIVHYIYNGLQKDSNREQHVGETSDSVKEKNGSVGCGEEDKPQEKKDLSMEDIFKDIFSTLGHSATKDINRKDIEDNIKKNLLFILKK